MRSFASRDQKVVGFGPTIALLKIATSAIATVAHEDVSTLFSLKLDGEVRAAKERGNQISYVLRIPGCSKTGLL